MGRGVRSEGFFYKDVYVPGSDTEVLGYKKLGVCIRCYQDEERRKQKKKKGKTTPAVSTASRKKPPPSGFDKTKPLFIVIQNYAQSITMCFRSGWWGPWQW